MMDSEQVFKEEMKNQVAKVTSSRHHHEEKEYRMSSDSHIPFYKNPLDMSLLVVSGVLVISITIALVVYRRRRKTRRTYEHLPDTSEKALHRLSEGSSYGGVNPTKSIEFVVPNLPVKSSCESPSVPPSSLSSGDPIIDSSSSSLDAPTCSNNFDKVFPALGGLNPELYKDEPSEQEDIDYPDGHVGRLWFGLEYDASTERLAIQLIKAKNLPSRAYGTVNCCDPFVRAYLMPDERRYLQSKIKKKTCNPVFEEIFVFQIPLKEVEEHILRLTVYDSNQGKKHRVIGHVLFPLKVLDINSNESSILWRDLSKDEETLDMGQLLVSLCYNQVLERLTVAIFEVKDISIPEDISNLDSYVKVSLMFETKVTKTKKTAIIRNSIEPTYNESFHFRILQNSVNSASVIIQLCVAGGPHKDKCLGSIVLGSYMFARGKALEHWNEAMATNHRQVRYWQKLS